MSPRYLRWLGILAVSSGLIASVMTSAASAAATDQQVVLTSLQATYSLTNALAEGTRIKVVNVPVQGAVMESQAHALTRVPDDVFRQADAVVTIGKLWRDDPLFPAARAHNLRIVNIDASFPWNAGDAGVSVMRRPVSDVPWVQRNNAEESGLSPFVWLSLTNAIRMSELIAADLARLSVPDAAKIHANQATLANQLRQLKAGYGARYAALPDPRVLSLADEFVYLLADLGVFVDGWFVKQDIAWTDADYAALTAYLKEHDIHVVVHKWMPAEKIVAAIQSANAKLVVLDAADPGVAAQTGALPAAGYQALLRADMEALLDALGGVSTP